MPPLPVTVLTGFLGAGKTTLLGRLLVEPHGQRVGVILNEIGIAGIDRLGGPVQTSYVELTNGCVCCVDQPDLLAAVDGLVGRGDLDRLVLETTGLADPLPLTWTLSRPELAAVVRLDGVVTVVDAANWRRTQVAEWEAQALGADLVVLSKRDLTTPAEAEALAAHLAGLNPHARLVDGEQGWRLALLGELGSPAPTGAAAPVAHHSRYLAVSFQERCRFDAGAIEDCLAALPQEVYRAKGLVRLDDGAWAAFHVVGGRLQVDLDVAAPSDGESRLVFFGEGLERARLDELLGPCRRPA